MNKHCGFSLVEAMVVLVIFALIITFGIPAFSSWNKRHGVEGQISKLYSDLQFIRMKAYSKVACGIDWGDSNSFNKYSIKSDCNDKTDEECNNGDFADPSDEIELVNLEYTITAKFSTGNNIRFDGRGYPSKLGSFYIAAPSNAANNCVKVSETRILMGKWDASAEKCVIDSK
ncbi:prepilin-type N-terminal cleavage/methylation domain-containing protein [Desulforhabdus sp. TSK]|uniref:prepilin-type N-terminal cleavage/methylation domain-containing protein n=1 Tax=Desulforhabdus sp. TSK TaxID=2925014 RepID=UPI001FC7E1FA|nr:prepilin-type N-terminal cleavage/methylation domain-containing protein [Desulforhabdus sp. TSK]GKT08980.1 hypothetical protein DSTSK_22850 [Desulforhabdus sp. TSK]